MDTTQTQTMVSASFKLPVSLAQTLDERVIADHYGMRGKSKWIRDAVEGFLALPGYVEFVGLSDEVSGELRNVTARIPRELMLQIEQAVLEVRKEYPGLEGVKSRIFRTSIIQRLIRQ